jgi:hypothetical protein
MKFRKGLLMPMVTLDNISNPFKSIYLKKKIKTKKEVNVDGVQLG